MSTHKIRETFVVFAKGAISAVTSVLSIIKLLCVKIELNACITIVKPRSVCMLISVCYMLVEF